MTGATRLIPRPALAKRWITALVMLAFFLQSLTVQTHVHQSLQPTAAKVQTGGIPKAPLKLDPIDQCRLCQELVHTGHFVAPSVVAAFASLSFVTAIFATQPSLSDRSGMAFSWRSRAPPRR